jgi:hypothetical protein
VSPCVVSTLARTVSPPIKSLMTCRSTLLSTGPAQLKGPFDSSGFPVGCKSACEAGLAPDPSNDPNCCTGRYNTAATCPSSGVQYYSYFSESLPAPSHTLLNLTECQNQIALIHTCMLMMSRAALHFSRVPRQTRRIIPLRSAPEFIQ